MRRTGLLLALFFLLVGTAIGGTVNSAYTTAYNDVLASADIKSQNFDNRAKVYFTQLHNRLARMDTATDAQNAKIAELEARIAELETEEPPPPPPSNEPAPIAGKGYSKVFSDEFDGTALSAQWNPKEFWEDEPPPGAVVVSNGTVKITNFKPFPFTDQSISTGPYWGLEQSKRSFMFGYFEARMKFTDAVGSWPAFWLLSREQAEWPNYPSCTNRDLNFELDIMEYQGDEPTQFYGTQHRNTGDVCGTSDSTRSVFTNPKKLAGDWHTFSAEWTSTTVSWYVDDVLQGSQPLFDSGDQQMVMSLTMQACGWDSTNACNAATPNLVTEVDWVRVWQK